MYDKITLSLFIQNVKQVKTMLHVIINELRFGLWQMIKIKKELCSFFLFMDRNIKWLSLVTDKKMWNNFIHAEFYNSFDSVFNN